MLDHEQRLIVLIVPSPMVETQGFTLIEMIIVIAIIALATTLGIPSYRTWVQNTQIYNAAESVQNGLQRTRAEAVGRNTNVAFILKGTSPTWDSAWESKVINPATVIDSKSANEGSKNISSNGRAIDPATGLVTNLAHTATTVTFNNLGQIVTSASSLAQIDFNSSLAGSRSLRVTIGANGVGSNVRMCDPYTTLNATDPRRC
jgi:type IV fimbrial biogenesis protein FimT